MSNVPFSLYPVVDREVISPPQARVFTCQLRLCSAGSTSSCFYLVTSAQSMKELTILIESHLLIVHYSAASPVYPRRSTVVWFGS